MPPRRSLAVLTIVILAAGVACRRHGRAPSPPLQLARVPPVIGERQTLTDQLDSHFEVSDGPNKVVTMTTRRTREFEVEARAVSPDGVVTAARAHFVRHRVEQTRDGATTTKPSPLEGGTYDVRVDGDALSATRADGATVSPEEQAALVADLGRAVGREAPLSLLLRGHAWVRGEPVELTPAELADAFGNNPMMAPVSGTALLVELAAGVATFEFDLALARDDGNGRAESTLRLTVKVDVARARPVEQRLIGTLGGKVAGMPSTGTLEGRITYVYAPAR